MANTPLNATRLALIKAGMERSLATRLAKSRPMSEPLSAWIAELKADVPDLFGVDPEAEEGETPADKGEPSISRASLDHLRETINGSRAHLAAGDKTASGVAAELLSRKPRPRQSTASQTSQSAAALLRRGIGNAAD
ncbi:hypothetical protein ACFWIB_11685 [Streptomyces sp. NPDC127051]|uniref:hypothetical protein n=1 Tax=Streptomyces sp. NPDC127051 TaxID=3347119 RepID=UPI00366034AD